jgi:hypothetical protein
MRSIIFFQSRYLLPLETVIKLPVDEPDDLCRLARELVCTSNVSPLLDRDGPSDGCVSLKTQNRPSVPREKYIVKGVVGAYKGQCP